jgi:hypothetical protein
MYICWEYLGLFNNTFLVTLQTTNQGIYPHHSTVTFENEIFDAYDTFDPESGQERIL